MMTVQTNKAKIKCLTQLGITTKLIIDYLE